MLYNQDTLYNVAHIGTTNVPTVFSEFFFLVCSGRLDH